MLRLAALTNRNAKRNRRDPELAEAVARVAESAGGIAAATETLEEAEAFLDRAMEWGCDALAVNSGDGGLMRAWTHLVRVHGAGRLPAVLPLNGGTANVTSSALGFRGGPVEILKTFIARWDGPGFAASLRTVQTLEVSFPDRPDEAPLYGWMLYFGETPHEYFKEFYNYPSHDRRALAALISRILYSSLRGGELFRRVLRRSRLEFSIDGGALQAARSFFGLAGCEDYSLLGLRPFRRSEAGRFNFINIDRTHWGLVRTLLESSLGIKPSGPGTLNLEAASVLVAPSREGGPNPFNIDGENLFWDSSFRIRPGPAARMPALSS